VSIALEQVRRDGGVIGRRALKGCHVSAGQMQGRVGREVADHDAEVRVQGLVTRRSGRRVDGWGNMPQHMVSSDLADGTLVSLDVEDMLLKGSLTMTAFHRASEPPGPAGRWLIDDLKVRYAQEAQ
jgi:DNA-binding transcriptional LysR family regulator